MSTRNSATYCLIVDTNPIICDQKISLAFFPKGELCIDSLVRSCFCSPQFLRAARMKRRKA